VARRRLSRFPASAGYIISALRPNAVTKRRVDMTEAKLQAGAAWRGNRQARREAKAQTIGSIVFSRR